MHTEDLSETSAENLLIAAAYDEGTVGMSSLLRGKKAARRMYATRLINTIMSKARAGNPKALRARNILFTTAIRLYPRGRAARGRAASARRRGRAGEEEMY